MAKEISIVIRARNAMAAGLASAEASLKAFGESALNIGSFFAKTFLAASGAILGFASKAVMSFAESEKAEASAAAAFRAYGEEVDSNVANVKRFAAAIQEETGADGDSLVARAAQLRMLGVMPNKLEDATRATVALTGAGMAEEAAVKALAMAQEGNFSALERMIPAVRNAASEQEKAAAINDFLTRGYSSQKDQLNTLTGQWSLFKARVGDVWEEIGGAIAQNGQLQAVFERASNAVKEFGQRIADWVASGGMTQLMNTIELFWEYARNSFTNAAIYAKGFFMGGVYNPAKAAFEYVGTIIASWAAGTVAEFEYLRDFAVAVWEKIKNPLKKFDPPSISTLVESYKIMFKSVKGEYIEKVPNAFETMNQELETEAQRNQKKLAQISKQQLDDYQKNANERVSVEQDAQKKIEVAVASRAEEEKKAGEYMLDQMEQIKDAEEKAGEEKVKRAEEVVNALEKEKDLRAEIAKKSIQDIIKEKKEAKDQQKKDKEDEKRAERLNAKQKKNVKLSKKDQEWLNAFNEQKLAQVALANAANALNLAKANLQQVKADNSKKLTDIKNEITKLRNDLRRN